MQASDQNYNGILHVFERKVNFGNVFFLYIYIFNIQYIAANFKGKCNYNTCVCVMVFLENLRFIIYNFK